MITTSTLVIFRYRITGLFYTTIEARLGAVKRQGASEVIATRIDSDMLDAGITFQLQIGTLIISTDSEQTGEPYEALDAAMVALDAIAEMAAD